MVGQAGGRSDGLAVENAGSRAKERVCGVIGFSGGRLVSQAGGSVGRQLEGEGEGYVCVWLGGQ